MISVQRPPTTTSTADAAYRLKLDQQVMPDVDAIITGKITKITSTSAHVDILVVNQIAVRHVFKGTIR
jgi:hypothetical protein